jgi:hypothetical protein
MVFTYAQLRCHDRDFWNAYAHIIKGTIMRHTGDTSTRQRHSSVWSATELARPLLGGEGGLLSARRL